MGIIVYMHNAMKKIRHAKSQLLEQKKIDMSIISRDIGYMGVKLQGFTDTKLSLK